MAYTSGCKRLGWAGAFLLAMSFGQQMGEAQQPLLTLAAETSASLPGLPPPASRAPAPVSLITSVQVDARADSLRDGVSMPQHVSQMQVLSSAGTWGDFTRYLQLLPGVVWTNDYSNEIRVRGGTPDENLFVVDGIEVPNINHFALEGTTGGFASMLDTSVVEDVDLTPGLYDAAHSARLSSLVDIRTIEGIGKPATRQIDVGIAGVGGTLQQSIGTKAAFLVSAHRSVLNLATNDIGVNGVPIYTNGMAKLDWKIGENDHIGILDLSGGDSIVMTPQPYDTGVTSPIRTAYSGLRSTAGLIWQHMHSSQSSSTLTASYSQQGQQIDQDWQTALGGGQVGETPVYREHTEDTVSSVGYRFVTAARGWVYSSGLAGRLVGLNYLVAQPVGAPSPFSIEPSWKDSGNFQRNFSTGEGAGFLEVSGHPAARWVVSAAAREETFALVGSDFLNAQVELAFRASEHQSLHAKLGRSAQLAPAINILSDPGNHHLPPMEATQASVGGELFRGDRIDLSMEAYLKRYAHEPVSTEYPALMLANMIDTLGQQFVWLPMKGSGTGVARGIALMLRANKAQHFHLIGDLTYSRTLYAAEDGIMRPSNFDFPVVANVLATLDLPWKFSISARNSFASGRPYTPFDIPDSEQQSRGIYDLTRVNAVRAPAYNRLDLDLIRSFRVGKGSINVHAGVENALNRDNFLGLVWMNSCHPKPTDTHCALIPMAVPGIPESQVSQMKIFPSAWVHYRF